MPVSGLIEVVIGIVFVWFLLSLVISAVNEAFASLTRVRAKLLWQTLARLFKDDLAAPGGRLRDLFIVLPTGREDHRPTSKSEPSVLSKGRAKAKKVARTEANPQLQALYDLLRRRVADPAPESWRTRINSIPRHAVSDALLRLAEGTVTKTSLLAVADKEDKELLDYIGGLNEGPLHRESLQPLPTAEQQDAFDKVWREASRVVTLEDLEVLVAKNSALAHALRTVRHTVESNDHLTRARDEIERWFDSSMAALTTFYRRQNRKIAAVIAVPLVLLTSADSLNLFQRLRADQDLRAAVTSSAAGWVAAPLDTTDTGAIKDLDAVCARVAPTTSTPTSTAAPPTTAAAKPEQAIDEARRRLDCAKDLVAATSLIKYIGPGGLWHEISTAHTKKKSCELCDVVSWLHSGFLGRAITWVALLFGASFWYDVLRRLVGLRGGGGKTAASG